MKKVMFFVALVAGSLQAQAQTQYYSSCQQAFDDARRLALYGTYGQSSIKNDVDYIKNVSDDIGYSLSTLNQINNSNNQVTQIASSLFENLSSNMVGNIQQTYNNNVNTQLILKAALQQYQNQLMNAGLGDVVNHINQALSSAAQAEQFAKAAENGANAVYAKAQQIENQINAQTQNISQGIKSQTNYLQRSNQNIQYIAKSLVGYNTWGGSCDPYSKLGTLERIMNYMQGNACIK